MHRQNSRGTARPILTVLARLLPSFCAVVILASSSIAQAPAELGKRTARSRYTLGYIFAVQELADGRVVASDAKEQVFRIIDFAKGDVGLIGRQGDDSDGYRAASVIVRLPGDSLGLYDPVGRKVLHITPSGMVARAVALPATSDGHRVGTLLGADLAGALYVTVPEQFDTVTKALAGFAGVTRLGVGADESEPQLTYRMRRADQAVTGIMPFYFRDAVAVRSDGLLARVIADTYQVVWIRNGKEVGRTEHFAFEPIPILQAEQQAIKDSVAETAKVMLTAGRGGAAGGSASGVAAGGTTSGGVTDFATSGFGSAQQVTVTQGAGGQRVIINGTDVTATAGTATLGSVASSLNRIVEMPLGKFPESKPPILSSGVVATFDRNGALWVARERVHGDPVPHYDVIAEGKGIVARVNLPAGTRLVGFGKNVVYLARPEDGSDWLERYALPKI